jgi:hypothetical protein
MQKAPQRIVAQWRRIIIRRDYARYDCNIWSEVATAAIKSSVEPTTKVPEIAKTAILRQSRATEKGAIANCEISNTAALRICAR